MTPQEANRIIAEYMGGPYVGDACQDSVGVNDGYTCCTATEICERCEDIDEHYLSLDALVPVWKKMGIDSFRIRNNTGYMHSATGAADIFFVPPLKKNSKSKTSFSSDVKTIQEASATATARAIMELTC